MLQTAQRNAVAALHGCHEALELDGTDHAYTVEEWLPTVYNIAGPLLEAARLEAEPPTLVEAAQQAISWLSRAITDLDERGMLKDTLVVAVGEFGRAPQKGVSTSGNGNSADGRDHWPYCYTAVMAGAGIKRGYVHGKSDKTGSAPLEDPVHPGELLATIYHAFGIDPATIVYNHLKQPRELVKAEAVGRLFA